MRRRSVKFLTKKIIVIEFYWKSVCEVLIFQLPTYDLGRSLTGQLLHGDELRWLSCEPGSNIFCNACKQRGANANLYYP